MRMLQPGRRPDLAQEAIATERGAEVRMEDLDGDLALVAKIVREVDRRHAALAELPLDVIAVGEGGGEASGRCGHCPAAAIFCSSSVNQFSTTTSCPAPGARSVLTSRTMTNPRLSGVTS